MKGEKECEKEIGGRGGKKKRKLANKSEIERRPMKGKKG